MSMRMYFDQIALLFTKSDISNELKYPKVSLFEIVFHPLCVLSFFYFIYMYAQSTNNETYTRTHYCFFVVRHVGTARLDSLDTLVLTRSTKSNVSSRVESRRAKWNLGHSKRRQTTCRMSCR